LILNLAGNSANDNTMQASHGGTLIFGSGTIDNTGGLIQAVNNGSTVNLQVAGISHGVVQAANGGTVTLQYGGIDHATLQALDGGTVNFSGSSSVSSSTLTTAGSGIMQALSGGGMLTDVTISPGSVVGINDNSYLTLSGAITNQGTIALNATGHLTSLVIQGQIYDYNTGTLHGGLGAQLTGGGTITLSDNPNNGIVGASAIYCSGLCYAEGPAAQLINQDNTIQGAGTVGSSSLSQRLDLINHGLVDANASNPLILNLAGNSANDNTMQASHGGTLIFGSGTIDNTGGLIQALAGSRIQFNNSTLDNQGTLKVAGGGTMVIASNLQNYASGTLTGGIYNVAGIMALPVPTSESIQTNAATIILDGPSSAIMKYADSSNALAGFASNTALGDFTIKNGANFASAGAFNNAGAMTFEAGSTFTVGGNNAYTQTAGITTVNGSLNGNLVTIEGGTLKGSGTVTGDVTVGTTGTVHPGNSPGVLTVNGNYTNTGILAIDILNLAQGPGVGYSELVVNGTATLGGILQLNLSPETVLHSGEIFDIIYALNGYTGQFTSITGLSSDFTEQFGPNYIDLVATKDVNPVPVPPSLFLFAGGLAGLIGLRRRVGRKVSRGNAN
jgi:hypothetical protein